MNVKAIALALAAILGFVKASWASPQDAAAAPSATPASNPSQAAPVSIWTKVEAGMLHQQTQWRCPETSASVKMAAFAANAYDAFGEDAGCDYQLATGGKLTLFLGQFKMSAKDYFQDASLSIRKVKPEAVEEAAPQPVLPQGEWFSTAFKIDGPKPRTVVWIADLHGWKLKVRATYALAEEAQILAAAGELAKNAFDTAGPHLAACATSPAPNRTGKWVEDKNALMMAAMTGGIMSAAASEDGAKPSSPVRWCLERSGDQEGVPIQLWRSAGGASDKITVMTIKDPSPVLNIVPDMIPAGLAQQKNASGRSYMLTAASPELWELFGLFDGRPSFEAVAKPAAEIFLGKRNAVGSHSTKDGKSTITVPAGR